MGGVGGDVEGELTAGVVEHQEVRLLGGVNPASELSGLDQVLESGADLLTPIDFGFGKCRLCLAAPRGSKVEAELGRSLRVATKYPRLTGRWFARRGVPVDLVALAGSVELAAVSGLTDAIVDLVESGRTLEENGLVVVDELLQVSARLVVNRASYRLKVEELLPLLEKVG